MVLYPDNIYTETVIITIQYLPITVWDCNSHIFLLFTVYSLCCFLGNVQTGQKEGKIPSSHSQAKNADNHGHVGHIFATAISSDGRYLVCCCNTNIEFTIF